MSKKRINTELPGVNLPGFISKKPENFKPLEPQPEEKSKSNTQMAIHAVTQFFGDNKQLTLFSDEVLDEYEKNTGLALNNRPDSYGVVLNQAQRRVFEGILKAFSDSRYTGHIEIDKPTYNNEIYPISKLGNAYGNIDNIPVIKLTQAELIELAGYDLKSQRQGDKTDVTEALDLLATKQFCFYWNRLKFDGKNKPMVDKKGKYIKEEVMEVGTLFRVKYVRENGVLQYYEIHPSAPLLDQVDNYFLLVPDDWREEVKQIANKRASSYTYEFLFWLRLQFEQIRRLNKKPRVNKPFIITKTWEEVAIALKMPETMYKRNRPRSLKIIQDAYDVAIKLGYLTKVENNGATDILYLNENFYPKPGDLQ